MTRGSYKRTEEYKKKMSESNKGNIPWNKGLKNCYSKETIKKMSEANKGNIPWNKKDLTGQKFNKLFVIKKFNIKNKKTYYECLCDCGNIKHIRSDALTSGITMSCGCLRKELSSKRCKNNIGKNASNYKDGCCDDIVKYNKQYRKDNPEKIVIGWIKYNGVKNDQTPNLTKEEQKRIDRLYEIRNLLNHNSKDFHVDHIQPLSKGGLHHPDNLQILPNWLNLEKHAKWPLTEDEQIRYEGFRL